MAEDRATVRPNKSLAPKISVFTILLFGLAGLGLMILQERDLRTVFIGDGDLFFQFLLGPIGGIMIAFLAWSIIKLEVMTPIRLRYSSMIGPVLASRRDRILVSICAGVGEEIFFRGAIQFWLGIIATAIIFVAIHGYLDPRNWRISLYGTFMTVAMLAIGWAAKEFGLVAPIIAHTIIDIVLLEKLHSEWKRSDQRLTPANTYADRNYPH